MPERKTLASITIITDHDTGMYHVGEIEGAFNHDELKAHIKKHGYNELSFQLAYLQFQLVTAIREVNGEKGDADVCGGGW